MSQEKSEGQVVTARSPPQPEVVLADLLKEEHHVPVQRTDSLEAKARRTKGARRRVGSSWQTPLPVISPVSQMRSADLNDRFRSLTWVSPEAPPALPTDGHCRQRHLPISQHGRRAAIG